MGFHGRPNMRQLRKLHYVRIVSRLWLSLTTTDSRFKQTNSELAKANPNNAQQIFEPHWQSWFTQADVQRLKELGMNTVRVPVSSAFLEVSRTPVLITCVPKLGYWIVEPLVEAGEYYPTGGFRHLVRLDIPSLVVLATYIARSGKV